MSKKSPRARPGNIANAVVVKDEDVFFLCDPSGDIPLGNVDGLGLYYHDCRYLNGYELRIGGTRPNALASTAQGGFRSAFELTNHDIRQPDGTTIPKQQIGLRWERIIDSGKLSLHDVITLRNYSHATIAFPVELAFGSAFDDVFTIRGFHPGKLGRHRKPAWKNGALTLAYLGADGVLRRLVIQFAPAPRSTHGTTAALNVRLGGEQSTEIRVSLTITEARRGHAAERTPTTHRSIQRVSEGARRSTEAWLGRYTQVTSNNTILNNVMDRSLHDLRVLRSSIRGREFFSAGLPWYGTLFGRDSLIAALETLAYEPKVAEDTLRLLASYQGTCTNAWRDEDPGKILHELRRGELANLNEIPQTPYYGSVDSTPLFLILMGLHAQWSGDLRVFTDLRRHVERALTWIGKYGESTGSGYLTYESKSSGGLGNQGWKDSGDSIMNADGSLATPPIALVEVQGYVYLAKLLIAELYEHAGDRGIAKRLRAEAADLRTRFNRDFWVASKGTYALALQKGNKQAAVVSSNPGQALWTGIIDPARAAKVVRTLVAPDMFSGWGIRTLSSKEKRYNPIGYHLGTVWPHDNGIIVAGLRQYGFDAEAAHVLGAIVRAGSHFEHQRLPETFCGFSRDQFAHPVRYPVACHPQAWAAGSVPFMLERLLGLEAHAFDKQLRIVRPVLPDGVNTIEVRQLRVGKATVSLRFVRMPRGHVGVDVIERRGDVRVDVEPEATRGAA